MNQIERFDHPEEFLARLRALVAQGADAESLQLYLPHELPEVEAILAQKPSRLRFFALFGGLTGFGGGLALTIGTALSWPIITGGKPIVSLPPFLIIAYLLTILLGSLGAFAGFLLLARLPSAQGLPCPPQEWGNQFVIVCRAGEDSCAP